jgi:hypothetical protein
VVCPCFLVLTAACTLCADIDKEVCTFERFSPSVEVCGTALSAEEVLQALLSDASCIQ